MQRGDIICCSDDEYWSEAVVGPSVCRSEESLQGRAPAPATSLALSKTRGITGLAAHP